MIAAMTPMVLGTMLAHWHIVEGIQHGVGWEKGKCLREDGGQRPTEQVDGKNDDTQPRRQKLFESGFSVMGARQAEVFPIRRA